MQLIQLARWMVVAGLALFAIAAAIWILADYRKSSAVQALQIAQSNLQQVSEELTNAEEARDRLEANLSQFEQLRGSGFVGEPDRVSLIEALEQAGKVVPGGAMRWEIGPAQTIESVSDPKTGSPVAEVRGVPMRLAADSVNESEWLEMLNLMRKSTLGQVRVQGCDWRISQLSWRTAVVPAVRSRCELLWIYTQPPEPAKPGSV